MTMTREAMKSSSNNNISNIDGNLSVTKKAMTILILSLIHI